jgi:hypothetical protein
MNLDLCFCGLRDSEGVYSKLQCGGIWFFSPNDSLANGLFLYGTYTEEKYGSKKVDLYNYCKPEDNYKRRLIKKPYYGICDKGYGMTVRCIKD